MEKLLLTHELYNKHIARLADKIKESGKTYECVYGIPRGGYYPAIILGQILKLQVVTEIKNANTLVVDDICDSGFTLAHYLKYDTAVVFCRPYSFDKCTYYGTESPKGQWIVFPDENGETVHDNIRRIFEYIGEDPNRTGLLGTPDRIVRMWKEIFRGYDKKSAPKITVFPNGEDGIVYDSMVIDEGDYYSMCVPGFQCVNAVGKNHRARDQKVGDKLWTIVNGIPVQTTITEITTHKADGYVNITLSNGRKFSVTSDHPLRSEGEWVEASDSLGKKVQWINPEKFTIASPKGVEDIKNAVSENENHTSMIQTAVSEEWFRKHGFEKYEENNDLGESEMVEVVGVEFVNEPTEVYSFKCDNEHTFCINGVLTHNCEHHMMPFFGHYWFAYIPNPKGKILGISKIGRVVDYCAAKLQVQERLTHDIVDMLEKALGADYPPLGIALVMRGSHLCKEMRGVKKKGIMTSSFLTGAFKNDAETRAEFMNFVNKK